MQETHFNIDLYTFCYNEAPIIPFMIDYWKALGIRRVYVYDNGSTDNSIELLSQYPELITIGHYKTKDGLDDSIIQMMKNNIWKKSDADWVIVCDMDEIIYCDDLHDVLGILKDRGFSVIKPIGVDIVMERFPKHIKGKLLHTYKKAKFTFTGAGKMLLFDPNVIGEMNYTPGAHNAKPKTKDGEEPLILKGFLFFLHCKRLSLNYILKKYRSSKKRLSETNKINKWGYHYAFSKKKLTDEFNDFLKKSKDSLVELKGTKIE